MLALARHFQAKFLQRGYHVGAVAQGTRFGLAAQVAVELLAGIGFDLQGSAQAGLVEEGPVRSGLGGAGAVRIVGSAPAVLGVQPVAQGIEGFLPAGRGDVEAFASREVATGGQYVDMDAAFLLAVQDGAPSVAVGLETSPSGSFELVQRPFDLGVSGNVFRGPSQHAGRVLVLELEAVGDGGDLVGIAAQDLDAGAELAEVVPVAGEVSGRRARRTRAVGEKLKVHRRPRIPAVRGGGGRGGPRRVRWPAGQR